MSLFNATGLVKSFHSLRATDDVDISVNAGLAKVPWSILFPAYCLLMPARSRSTGAT